MLAPGPSLDAVGLAPGLAPLLVLLAGLLADMAVGDPSWLYRRIWHPAAAIGKLVGALERALNRPAPQAPQAPRSRTAGVVRGGLALALIVALCGGLAWAAAWALATFANGWPGVAVEALIVAILIAFRSLDDHVRAVAAGLRRSLGDGRQAVRHIVGRNPDSLDAAGVSRAAIESLAENFSDGVVAPMFWFLLFGLP